MSESDKFPGVSRRQFFKTAAAASAGAALVGCGGSSNGTTASDANSSSSGSSSSDPWYGSAPNIDSSDVVEKLTTDILVCGAGNAGLCAAMTAGDAGAKTLVLEKGNVAIGLRGGTGAIGSKVQKAKGINTDPNTAVNELARYASNHCNVKLIRTWAEKSGETADWLADILAPAGITPYADEDVGDGTHGIFKVYSIETGFNVPFGANKTQTLVDHAVAKGVEFRYQTTLVKLIREGGTTGRVTGAYAKNSDGKYIQITVSKAVILCTGGYACDEDLFAKLNPYAASVTTQNSSFGTATGDGLKAGIWVGAVKQADATAMLFDRGGVAPGEKAGLPFRHDGVFTGGTFVLGSQPFPKVNSSGVRFTNEFAPYDWTLYASGYQKGGTWTMLFDANWYSHVQVFHTIGCSRVVPDAAGMGRVYEGTLAEINDFISQGRLQQADTIAELADKLKLPSEALQNTVSHYNEMAAAGNDDEFGRPAYTILPLNTPPYYGITCGACLLCTLDGLMTDENGQCIDSSDSPIEGLYAAGNDSGGFFNQNYPELFVSVAAGRGQTLGRYGVRHALGL